MRWSWFWLASMVINYTLAMMFFALGSNSNMTACCAVVVASFAMYRQELEYEADEDDEA